MAERTNARLLKSREVQASVGSNPTPSARCSYYNVYALHSLFTMSGRLGRECSLFEPNRTHGRRPMFHWTTVVKYGGWRIESGSLEALTIRWPSPLSLREKPPVSDRPGVR